MNPTQAQPPPTNRAASRSYQEKPEHDDNAICPNPAQGCARTAAGGERML